MKRVIEKTIVLLRYMKLWVIYKPKGLVTVLGKVYLNNPNIRFGSNVTLYPNVHIFGQGRVTLEDNVSIGDGTIICAAEDITIGKNTMIAAQCYIIDCNHGMHLGGTCVNSHCQYIQQRLAKMCGWAAVVKSWRGRKSQMVQ